MEFAFPQIWSALRLVVVTPVAIFSYRANLSGKRAFSKLLLIENHLRSTTAEEGLNHSMLLSIELELADKLSFENFINELGEKDIECFLRFHFFTLNHTFVRKRQCLI